MTGKLITIEGIDGAGKSTLAKSIINTLLARGLKVGSTFEPTRGEIGLLARQAFDPAKAKEQLTECEWARQELLLAADRMDHIASFILPALEINDVVICDRYVDSGFAYGIASAMLKARIAQYPAERYLEGLYSYVPEPDHMILLDVSPAEAMRRTQDRREASTYDRDEAFLWQVRNLFLHRAELKKDRTKVYGVFTEFAIDDVFTMLGVDLS